MTSGGPPAHRTLNWLPQEPVGSHGRYIDAPQTGERVHIKSLAHGLHAIDGARRLLK